MREEYKDTPIGMIPEEWELTKIGSICNVRRGASPRPINDPKWWGGSVGWVRISDVTSTKKYLTKTNQYLSSEGVTKSVQIPIGEVIVSICATIGKPVIMKMDACIHDGFVWFEGLKDNINREFLYYFFLLKQDYLASTRQTGTQGNLNTTIVGELNLPLPSFTEQSKIVSILCTVDDKIDAINERITQTQQLKNGLMQRLLTRGIGHTKFKDSPLGEIPESWEVKRLINICKMITDGSHYSPKPMKESGFYIATVKDMQESSFDLSTCARISITDYDLLVRNGCKPKQGDVLFSKDGTIGKTFVFKGKQDLVILSSIAIIEPNPDFLFSDFLSQYLKSSVFLDQLEGLKSGSAIRRLVLKAIKEIKVLLPSSIEEQQKISSILNSSDEKVEVLQEKKNKYEQLKKGLMQQLLTGKIRVSTN